MRYRWSITSLYQLYLLFSEYVSKIFMKTGSTETKMKGQKSAKEFLLFPFTQGQKFNLMRKWRENVYL